MKTKITRDEKIKIENNNDMKKFQKIFNSNENKEKKVELIESEHEIFFQKLKKLLKI